MPTYLYRCPKCGEITIKHKPGEKVEECPVCGSEITRVYTAPMIRFVGKGFYTNDKNN